MGNYASEVIDQEGNSVQDGIFVYSNGTFTPIEVPGAIYIYAVDINNSGQVVGYYQDKNEDKNFVGHGFVYSDGTFTILDVPGATSTYAASINDSGQVVGEYTKGTVSRIFMFLYSNGTLTTFGTHTKIFSIIPWCINNNGQVVGSYSPKLLMGRGFIATPYPFTPPSFWPGTVGH